ncbi:MAG: glutamate--tRNA ligase [Parcubacteria group bacterium]|nr:glutamate--tRNA ligase [Parcubacteria group bacterium]
MNILNLIFGSKDSTVVTRISPSPTGNLHVGTARAALFNYLFAKRNGGKFIIRIEDTDKERSEQKYEENILEGLLWLGLSADKIVRQSNLLERHKECIERLLKDDKAYEVEENGNKIIRLRNSGGEITFTDLIRGEITFDVTELGDFIIARSKSSPLYHLAVVVDDNDMGITHVIRGEDHISNTPRQILIQEALGYKRPEYAHIPLILGPDRSKLSKRTGSTSVSKFKENGYIASAFLNYLALLGWNPGDDRELFTIDELIKEFKLENVQKGGAIFDEEKLRWFNREHILQMSDSDKKEYFAGALLPFDDTIKDRMIPVVIDRVSTSKELEEAVSNGEFDYLREAPVLVKEELTWKDDTLLIATNHLEKVVKLLSTIPDNNFNAEEIKQAVWGYASREGTGSVLWPMRYALTGKKKSPDPFSVAYILGKEETISRLRLQ